MGKEYKGKEGISIQLITNKINELTRTHKNRTTKNDSKKGKIKIKKTKVGKLKSTDMRHIMLGLEVLEHFGGDLSRREEEKLTLSDQEDISKLKLAVFNYKNLIDTAIFSLRREACNEASIKERMENLESYSQIAQATRDGIILKKETRIEKVDGEERKVEYDTSMTEGEVRDIFATYERLLEEISVGKLRNYLDLGLSTAGILGAIKKDGIKHKDKKETAIILSNIISSALPLVSNSMWRKEHERRMKNSRKLDDFFHDTIYKEQISQNELQNSIDNTFEFFEKSKKEDRKDKTNEMARDLTLGLVTAIVTGMYINSKVKVNEKGKIDAKSLVKALAGLRMIMRYSNSLTRTVERFKGLKEKDEEYQRACDDIRNILLQMEEKVYPLQGATHAFDKMEIKDLEGRFYPKTDYETGEINYSTKLSIPEFSMKRGETVLLSGKSGEGKSTFLRLLKRGDINNQKCITLDGKEQVDSLGSEYVSFRPDLRLGNNTNMLYQITGKESISDLTDAEKENLIGIMKKLGLSSDINSKVLLESLASKKFNEYSTGQQKRLALSKILYRINDGTSAIIVDEPVGNVEDDLIKQQLEVIKEYAKEKNAMLLLVTHRLDIASKFADKRYHIEDGVMKEIPVIKKDKNEAEKDDNQR